MHSLTETELKRLLLERFQEANLLPFIVEGQQQCLELEEEFFVEIVLKDASKLNAAREVVEVLKTELRPKGIEIDAVLRALWNVKEVRYLGPPLAESGGIRSAVRFHVVLFSGTVEQIVEVDVSTAAAQELERLAGRTDSERLNKLVENFVLLQLSTGGTSYWDPMRYRHLDLGPAAVLYLLHHSPMAAA